MKRKNSSNIILIGFMGCGKTTIGKALATYYKREFRDTDKMIVESSGKTIDELFSISENYFRTWERDICRSLKKKENLIISTGGGLILNKENRDILKDMGLTVFLKASVNCIYERTKNSNHRPLLNVSNKKEVIQSKLNERNSLYEELSNLTILVDNLTITEIVDKIVSYYEN
jgi:shikimate kinase